MIIWRIAKIMFCLGFCWLLAGEVFAQNDKKAYQLMQTVYNEGKKHRTQEMVVEMVIRDSKKRERHRYFRNRKLQETKSLSKSLIRFFRPANVSGTSLLNWKDEKNDQVSQWLYLPAVKNVRQLNSDSRNDSFMGSDFSYADIAGRQLNQDNHTIVQETGKFIFVESIPKNKNDVYAKFISVIDPKLRVARRVVFYDRKNKKLKTLDNNDVTDVKGMNIVTGAKMSNHQSGGTSDIKISDIKVGHKISANEVGIQSLRTN